MAEHWVDRERRTGRLIRTVFDEYLPKSGRPSSEALYALCRLTWITKGGGSDYTDNTAAVVAPALSEILGVELTATTPAELADKLRRHDVPEAVVKLASRPVGIVNYYAGFRTIAKSWLKSNRDQVWDIVRAVESAVDDAVVRDAYAAIDRLPLLPRPRAGDGQPSNLLTPLLACLDPRSRAPIINGRKEWLLRKLRLASSTMAEQHDGLVNLIGQAGINDTFDLDVADERQIERAMKVAPKRPKASRPSKENPAKQLAERHDEDVEFLRAVDRVKMRQLHHTMTNALRALGKRGGLTILEGSEQTCLFDALIRGYRGAERHLLVEVKTDDAMPMCRMAVGQLLDYRRHLEDRAAVELAVLFPVKPTTEALAFLGVVGVKAIWFDEGMKNILGGVTLKERA